MATKKLETDWGHCPKCGPRRLADIVAEHKGDYSIPDEGIYETIRYRIMCCRGCTESYFQKFERSHDPYQPDDDQSPPVLRHWPHPQARKRPDWMKAIGKEAHDVGLDLLLGEVYLALDHEAHVLAAIGMRTIFDVTSELLGVDAELSFKDKLKTLEDKGKIGKDEQLTLAALTEAGSAAAHRGWRPPGEELALMMEIVEQFVYRSFIIGSRVEQLKRRVPPRKNRKKVAPPASP